MAEIACLPDKNDPGEGTVCWAAGWGRMDDSGRQAENLQEVDLKIISPETCHKTKNSGFLVDEAMFCAGYIEGGKDGCQGDSGGPLICAENGRPVLRGITSRVSKI